MSGRLRRQLIHRFVVFALALGALFAVVTLFVFHRVEDRLARQQLEQMLARSDGASPSQAIHYVGPPEAAPEPFADRVSQLEPGFHEWEDSEGESHALVTVDPSTGQRTIALVRFAESEASQSRFGLALLAGVGITSLVALFLARTLAVRLVTPIEQLTTGLAGPFDTVGALGTAVPAELTSSERDDEIGTLARTLQRAGLDLAAASERERRFLREASHELRTPITVIQGVSDLLRDSMDRGDTLTRRRLERLERSLRRMNTSVLSLLAMARAEHRLASSEMPPFEQQLDDLLEEARALAQPGVTVTATVDHAPTAPFAASMLIVALSNLARNAAQHTAAGTIAVHTNRRQAQVVDTGPGLPQLLLDQLHGDGPQPDLGIGLATVLRICRRLGWELTVDCPEDGGTVATIEFLDE